VAQQEYSELKAEFDRKAEQAKIKMQEMKDAAGDTWEAAQKAFSGAMDELKQAYNKAAAKFQDE
jgi:hypothetical protein